MGATVLVYIFTADAVFNDSKLLKSTWNVLSSTVKSVWDSTVYPVVAVVAGILGFNDQILEAYNSVSISLFRTTLKSRLPKSITTAILNEEDTNETISKWVKTRPSRTINRFKKYTVSDDYPVSNILVESTGSTISEVDLNTALMSIEGSTVTIGTISVSTLKQSTYNEYYLQLKYGKLLGSSLILVEGTTYTITNITNNISNYIVNFVESNPPVVVIPLVPIGTHYIVYYKVTTTSLNKLFVYKANSGGLPLLDNSTPDYVNSIFNVYPPIPLRIANVNYNVNPDAEIAVAKDKALNYLNINGKAILDEIVTISNSSSVDNIYIDFSVDVLSTSDGVPSYMYNLMSDILLRQDTEQVVIDSYTSSYSAYISNNRDTLFNPKISNDYNKSTIKVTSEDSYDSAFGYTYIAQNEYTKAEVDANTLSKEYIAFYSNPDPTTEFYTSDYTEDTDTSGFVSVSTTNSVKHMNPSSVITPTININASPVDLIDFSGSGDSYDGNYSEFISLNVGTAYVLKFTPNILGGNNIALVPYDIGYSINYYRVIPNRLVHIEVFNPVSLVRVKDGDTGRFKVITSYLKDFDTLDTDNPAPNRMRVPLLEQYMAVLSNKEKDNLFLKSINVRIMSAQVQVVPWYQTSAFASLVKAIGIAWAIYSGDKSIYTLGKTLVTQYLILELVKYAAEEYNLSPEETAVVYLGLTWLSGGFDGDLFSNSIATVNSMSSSLNIYIAKEYNLLKDLEKDYLKDTAQIRKDLKEANDLLGDGYGNPIDLKSLYTRTQLTNMTPEQYITSNNYAALSLTSVDYAETFIKSNLDLNRLQSYNLFEQQL